MSASKQTQPNAEAEQVVLNALRGLRYGAVEVTVHDARIVEVTRKEKQRLEPGGKPADRQNG
jgi:hypothetical protein